MLKQEFQYYLDHQDELVKKYSNKYIIIKDGEVKGAYDSKNDAYFEGQKKFDLGTFLIQYCMPGNMAFSQTYYTQNVAF
jgi:hypothetical protein